MKRLFSGLAIGGLIVISGGSSLVVSKCEALAQDASRGSVPCEETATCAANAVIACADWNDRK